MFRAGQGRPRVGLKATFEAIHCFVRFPVVLFRPVPYCRPSCRLGQSRGLQKTAGKGIMGKLNTAKMRTLTKPGVYGDGDGLYLQVRSADRRTWIFRFRLASKDHWMGLGTVADVSLAEARETAAATRRRVRQGIDPIDARDAERAARAAGNGRNTFATVAAAYLAAHELSWRNPKHRQQWRNTLDTYAAPVLGKLNVAGISTADVMSVLNPIWREKPETASRLRGRIEAILDYATTSGLRTGENPARWRGHLANLLPTRSKIAPPEHHAALPWRKIGGFMQTLAGQEGVAALALRLTILTAARTGEVIGARWEEIDPQTQVWTVPAKRMKAGREHRVPLSGEAVQVLRRVAEMTTGVAPDETWPASGFIFPGGRMGKPLSNMAMAMLLKRMGRDDLTVHGFRSTFRQWCAESANTPREVAEAALAHTPRDKVEAAYQRGDVLERRRILMSEWAQHCLKPASESDVVPLRTVGRPLGTISI